MAGCGRCWVVGSERTMSTRREMEMNRLRSTRGRRRKWCSACHVLVLHYVDKKSSGEEKEGRGGEGRKGKRARGSLSSALAAHQGNVAYCASKLTVSVPASIHTHSSFPLVILLPHPLNGTRTCPRLLCVICVYRLSSCRLTMAIWAPRHGHAATDEYGGLELMATRCCFQFP